jgi:hypothetical protein
VKKVAHMQDRLTLLVHPARKVEAPPCFQATELSMDLVGRGSIMILRKGVRSSTTIMVRIELSFRLDVELTK